MIEIPIQIDDMPISPEAFRVYVAIARSVAEYQEFPSIDRIAARCFNKKYAAGKTHARLALRELIRLGLIQSDESGSYRVSRPGEWEMEGAA
ncbi:MAG: Planktothrix phage PaV-LD [Cyanobacteriota bacterium]|jgi:hypothetical protein